MVFDGWIVYLGVAKEGWEMLYEFLMDSDTLL